jgi:hypothetical protein
MSEKQLTPESLHEWEEKLGPEKVQLACDLLRSWGWHSDDRPPLWVWQEAYLMVDGRIPMAWGDKSPRLDEKLLGFKLF